MEKKLRTGKFDFEDFLEQMQQMRKLGPLQQLTGDDSRHGRAR